VLVGNSNLCAGEFNDGELGNEGLSVGDSENDGDDVGTPVGSCEGEDEGEDEEEDEGKPVGIVEDVGRRRHHHEGELPALPGSVVGLSTISKEGTTCKNGDSVGVTVGDSVGDSVCVITSVGEYEGATNAEDGDEEGAPKIVNDGAINNVGNSEIDGLRQGFVFNFRRYDVGVRFRASALDISFSDSIVAMVC
jgi:hypothetical protein